jgi:hypothetical protein
MKNAIFGFNHIISNIVNGNSPTDRGYYDTSSSNCLRLRLDAESLYEADVLVFSERKRNVLTPEGWEPKAIGRLMGGTYSHPAENNRSVHTDYIESGMGYTDTRNWYSTGEIDSSILFRWKRIKSALQILDSDKKIIFGLQLSKFYDKIDDLRTNDYRVFYNGIWYPPCERPPSGILHRHWLRMNSMEREYLCRNKESDSEINEFIKLVVKL